MGNLREARNGEGNTIFEAEEREQSVTHGPDIEGGEIKLFQSPEDQK